MPEAVSHELAEGRLHGVDLPNIESITGFTVKIVNVGQRIALPTSLGSGEQEVLSLAAASPDCLVLLDDALAREHARKLGLRLTGTLGILLKAKHAGLLIEIQTALDKLKDKGFRIDQKTYTAVLNLAQEI